MPYRYFRMLWIGASILAAWGGSWLLSLRLRGRRRLAFAVLSALFLLVSGVMHDCLRWGQVSCFLFAVICVLASRRFRGVLAGVSSALLLLMVRSERRPQREYLLSLACLLLVVALPFVWLHYRLVLLVPLRYLLAVGRGRAALLLWVSIMLYGLPLSSTWGFWASLPGLRSLVPLCWLAYLAWRPAGATSVGMDAQPEGSPV